VGNTLQNLTKALVVNDNLKVLKVAKINTIYQNITP